MILKFLAHHDVCGTIYEFKLHVLATKSFPACSSAIALRALSAFRQYIRHNINIVHYTGTHLHDLVEGDSQVYNLIILSWYVFLLVNLQAIF